MLERYTKYILGFICVIVLSSQIPERIEFIKYEKGKWLKVKEKAKTLKKPLFVKCYTKWCATCRSMDRHVFTDQKIAKYYNEHFLNYGINMEKKEGPALKDSFKVTAYPTFIYFNKDGKEVHRFIGGKDVDELLAEGKLVLDSLINTSK